MSEPAWSSLHILCGLPDPGGPLLRTLAMELPGRWWHVPGVWQAGDLEQPALEIAVDAADVPRALSLSRPHGTVCRVGGPPGLLRPGLFPDETPPPCWPDLLTLGSARVANFDSDGLVRRAVSEVDLTWRGLVPHDATRRAGMRWHRRWLDAVLAPNAVDAVVFDAAPTIDVPGVPGWRSFADPLRRECAALRLAAPDHEVPILVTVVARLAHIQVVRILGSTPLAAGVERQALKHLDRNAFEGGGSPTTLPLP